MMLISLFTLRHICTNITDKQNNNEILHDISDSNEMDQEIAEIDTEQHDSTSTPVEQPENELKPNQLQKLTLFFNNAGVRNSYIMEAKTNTLIAIKRILGDSKINLVYLDTKENIKELANKAIDYHHKLTLKTFDEIKTRENVRKNLNESANIPEVIELKKKMTVNERLKYLSDRFFSKKCVESEPVLVSTSSPAYFQHLVNCGIQKIVVYPQWELDNLPTSIDGSNFLSNKKTLYLPINMNQYTYLGTSFTTFDLKYFSFVFSNAKVDNGNCIDVPSFVSTLFNMFVSQNQRNEKTEIFERFNAENPDISTVFYLLNQLMDAKHAFVSISHLDTLTNAYNDYIMSLYDTMKAKIKFVNNETKLATLNKNETETRNEFVEKTTGIGSKVYKNVISQLKIALKDDALIKIMKEEYEQLMDVFYETKLNASAKFIACENLKTKISNFLDSTFTAKLNDSNNLNIVNLVSEKARSDFSKIKIKNNKESIGNEKSPLENDTTKLSKTNYLQGNKLQSTGGKIAKEDGKLSEAEISKLFVFKNKALQEKAQNLSKNPEWRDFLEILSHLMENLKLELATSLVKNIGATFDEQQLKKIRDNANNTKTPFNTMNMADTNGVNSPPPAYQQVVSGLRQYNNEKLPKLHLTRNIRNPQISIAEKVSVGQGRQTNIPGIPSSCGLSACNDMSNNTFLPFVPSVRRRPRCR